MNAISATFRLGLFLDILILADLRGQEVVELWLSPWPAGAQAAVSITFDDGYPSQVGRAAPLLEAHGFRGTFYLIGDKLFQRGKYHSVPSAPVEQWQAACRRGHEMGSHTLTHVPLDTLALKELMAELSASKEALEETFAGARVTSLAYPFSRANDQVVQVARSLYTSGRLGPPAAGEPVSNDPAGADLLVLKSLFLCGGQDPRRWNDTVDCVVQDQGWLVETLHPIDEAGYCQVRAGDLAVHLDYLSGLGERLWVAPVADVAERLANWRQLELQLVEQTARGLGLQLTGPASAGYDWQVGVTVDDARAWRILDSNDCELPVRAQDRVLCFTWPTAQQHELIRLHKKTATAVVATTWGQLKQNRGSRK